MLRIIVGIIVGMLVGTPAAHAAASQWREYRGGQTGEMIVCRKVKNVPAIEKDIHKIKGKTYVVTWCNGKTWGKR